jgi:hypothetical protein
MDKLTQDAHWRQRMMLYCATHGLTKTSDRFHVSRKCVWKWRCRWDGTWQSLMDRSRRPRTSPRRQSPSEEKLVRRYGKKYRDDLLLGYQKARNYGYTRSYGCFKRTVSRLLGKPAAKKKKAYKPKPYHRADYPGQKLQLDVKYVPAYCVSDGRKYYQFTAKDECSRWTFREMYDEHSTYSARDFLEKLVKRSPFPIRAIQTDNGTEFTNALLVTKSKHKTLFEQALVDMGISYHRIRIATPRHNGKVERQHRTDELRFYRKMRMYSLEDGRRQLSRYQDVSNGYIMSCLNFRSPNEVLALYLGVM